MVVGTQRVMSYKREIKPDEQAAVEVGLGT